MSGGSSKDYIVRPAGSSVGAFGGDFTPRWTHGLYQTSALGRSLVAAAEEDSGNSVQILLYRDAATGERAPITMTDERLLCHALLFDLPDVALPDAFDALVDVWRDSDSGPWLGPDAPQRISSGGIASDRRADPIIVVEA